MDFALRSTPLSVAILLVLNSSQAFAAPGDPDGIEFKVNTYTASAQNDACIAMDADGDFVIAWSSVIQDGDNYGIYAQRYNAAGATVGNEFKVNTYTTNIQRRPAIAMDADGDFVIAWNSFAQDGDFYGVYAQRYTAAGAAAGNEFKVNTYTDGSQKGPSVAMDADGDFVISWTSLEQDGDGYGVYARRYDAAGNTVGSEFPVNTTALGDQDYSSVAMDADGDFVVSWNTRNQDGSGLAVYARRYSAAGAALGDEFRVNTFTAGAQGYSDIAMDVDGDFVIAWQSVQDGDGYGIYAQRYNAAGAAVGDEFLVNTYTTGSQSFPSVAMDALGRYVITWNSSQDGSFYGVYAQRYNAAGSPAGSEFKVNTFITNSQKESSVAMDADGDFAVAWESGAAQDGSDYGVFAQRYTGAANTVDLSLVLQDDTDPVSAGSNFIYSLITTNNGSGIALDVDLSMPLPTGLTYVSDDAAIDGWNCMLAVDTLECNRQFIVATEVSTINVTVTADTVGTLSNTVTVSAAQTDINVADNTDTETTEVTAAVVVPPAPVPSPVSAPAASSSGSLGVFSLLLALPLWLRRRLIGQ